MPLCSSENSRSQEVEKEEKILGKSLSSECARARIQKQQKEALRRAAPERAPTVAQSKSICPNDS
jgi:hypothetical protein